MAHIIGLLKILIKNLLKINFMKKSIYLLMMILFFQPIFSQETQTASVEKSIFGIQSGLLGVWVNNESRLTNQLALRAEVGYNLSLFGGSFYPKTGFLMKPVISVEPRWYYNLESRKSKSRNISGNSGNFFTVQCSYSPNKLALSNYDNIKIISNLSIIPTWGIRRTVGKHFTYETAIGIGNNHFYAKNAGYASDKNYASLNLHLRLGYTF